MLDPLGEAEPMERLDGQGLQDEEVERSMKEVAGVARHGSPCTRLGENVQGRGRQVKMGMSNRLRPGESHAPDAGVSHHTVSLSPNAESSG